MIPSNRRVNANPRDPSFYQDPYRFYRENRQFALFFWDEYELWCASSFQLVNSILRDRRFARSESTQSEPIKSQFNNAGVAENKHLQHFHRTEKHSLLNLEPPQHTQIRALVNHAFINKNVEQLTPQISALAESLLKKIEPVGHADLLTQYATPLTTQIIAGMLGVPMHCINQMVEWSHAMVKVYTLVQSYQEEQDADHAAREFADMLQQLIEQRRRHPTDDLLSELIQAELNGQRLRDEEIISNAILLLNAGHEASVHQFGNAVKTILESAIDPQQLFSSPTQTDTTINELLRYDAPLHLFTRIALTDIELDNIPIKKGQEIALLLGAANRDEQRFKDSDLFNPWREDNAQLSLGAGIHYCLGAQLAKRELSVGLRLLFQRLKNLRLSESASYRDSFHFHGLEKLNVCWD